LISLNKSQSDSNFQNYGVKGRGCCEKRILIRADIVPTETNYEYFKAGDAERLLGKEQNAIFDRADYRIFNLETLPKMRQISKKVAEEKIHPIIQNENFV